MMCVLSVVPVLTFLNRARLPSTTNTPSLSPVARVAAEVCTALLSFAGSAWAAGPLPEASRIVTLWIGTTSAFGTRIVSISAVPLMPGLSRR